METTKEFILTEGGDLYRQTVSREKLDAQESILDSLADNILHTARNVFAVDKIPVHASLGKGSNCYTVLLPGLPLRTHFIIDGDILVPSFKDEREPEMSFIWKVPTDMKLAFAVETVSKPGVVILVNQWLLAFDSEKRAYRLPLGNLFDTGQLCAGDMKESHQTVADAVKAAYDQLHAGKWQGDLDKAAAQTRQLFRFKLVNSRETPARYEQLPSEGTWQSNSIKINPAITKSIVL